MKMVKSLLLGTAAGLVAVAGAQAADLPVKAKPVQYVKICSLYGAGFYYMPGTDTCLKVGGFVRAETMVNAGGSFSQRVTDNYDDRDTNRMSWRARAAISLDARSQTEYGTLRSYMQWGYNHTSGAGAGDALYSNRAFIQWAGFTGGLASSFFDAFGFSGYSNQTNVLTSDTGGAGMLLWAYTAQFGNGLSASVSIEDPANRRTAISGAGGYGGNNLPDFVANLRIDQAWGSAQVMGAVHQVYASNPGYENEMGYAVGAYVKVNLPMLGAGDNISAQVAYGKGATAYNFRAAAFGFTNDGTTATGLVTDAVGGPAAGPTELELTESWSVGAGFQHVWSKQWKTSIYGGYGAVNYSDTAETYLGTAAGLSSDFTFWQAGTRTVWTPVANLDLSVDVIYNNINTSSAPNGLNRGLPVDDQGWFAGIFRAQRNFYP